MADLTRILTGEGVLWLVSVRDAFANRIVGWATDPRATTSLVLTATGWPDEQTRTLLMASDRGMADALIRQLHRPSQQEGRSS